MKIITKPSELQIEELKKWLCDELINERNGFYHNWDIITNGIFRKCTVLFEEKNEIIGFAQWSEFNKSITLNLFNIKNAFQKKGFGLTAYKLLENKFLKKDYLAINLFCEPKESELFWIKMGFEKIPETRFANHELSYWKPIINILKLSSTISEYSIELWDTFTANGKAKWVWNISNPNLDIVQYIDYDWFMRITIAGEIIHENKVKRITDKLEEFIVAPYLYIPITRQLELIKEKQP